VKKQRWENGYMTMEASFLIPMVLIIIALVMLLTFYLYSVCFLNQAAYIAALRGSLVMDGNALETTEKELSYLLENRLLRVGEISSEVTASAFSVKVRLEAETSLPLTDILPIRETVWEIEAMKEAKIRNAAAYIRLIRNMGG